MSCLSQCSASFGHSRPIEVLCFFAYHRIFSMNIQSRIRDLDATAARPKGRQGWIARHRASAIALLLGLIALGGSYYWYAASSNAAGKPVVVAATRGDVGDGGTARG